MTVLSLMLMTVLGVSLVVSADNENRSANGEALANQAYYAAEAGLDQAVMVLRGNKCPLDSTDACANATSSRNQINLQVAATASSSNLSTDTVTYARLSRWLTYSATSTSGAVILNPTDTANNQLSFQLQIVKLNTTDIQITSTGMAPQGARRTLKMKLKDSSVVIGQYNLLNIPAAVTMLGNNPKGTVGKSAAKSLSGYDCGTAVEKPIIGAVGQTNSDYLWTHSLNSNTKGEYGTTFSNATSGIVADISVPNAAYGVTGQIPFDNNQVKANQFVNEISQVAHRVVNSGSDLTLADMGTSTTPKTVLVKGDLTLTNSGTGLLVVTGNLVLNGNVSYDGLIVVLGKGGVTRNGAGNGTIKGGIIIAKYDDASLDDSIFDPNAYIDTNGGGNSLIQYCSTSIAKALNSIPAASVTTVYQ